MKIRTVKKVLKAWTEDRYTPLFKKVTLDNITFFEYNRDHKKK